MCDLAAAGLLASLQTLPQARLQFHHFGRFRQHHETLRFHFIARENGRAVAEFFLHQLARRFAGGGIPRKIRRLVLFDHPDNVEFPGYFKGAVFQGAMSGADAFFFPSYEETEGIVVLEALASEQNVVLRDIPVYQGWVDERSAELCNNVDEFVQSLRNILDKKVDKQIGRAHV